jgi:hypothetical protein
VGVGFPDCGRLAWKMMECIKAREGILDTCERVSVMPKMARRLMARRLL